MIKKGKNSPLFITVTVVITMIILTGITALCIYLNSVNNYKEKVANTQINEIDISQIPDGSYIGYYDVGFIYAKVEVVVKDGSIINIKLLEHKNDRGSSAESIISDIIKAQSLNVDAVSGATNSSTVIKKAVEIALTKAKMLDEHIQRNM
jgi:uncharacterized protein with FMN-binding domain